MIAFKTVDVYHQVHGGTLVAWSLAQPAPAGTTFRVWYSDNGVADWRLVGTVVDGVALVDVQRRQYAVDTRVAYRVDAEAGTTTATSGVSYAGGIRGAHNSPLAAAILRKERMLLAKRTGTPGRLWKRKHWGDKCSACVDPDTGEPRDSHCPVCFGTGLAGGYYPAVDYVMALSASRARKLTNTDQGMVDPQKAVGRALACPRLDTGDVWANCATDERWVIGAIQETLFQGVGLLYEGVDLTLAPAADAVYSLPREGQPGGAGGGVLVSDGQLLVWDTQYAAYYPLGLVGSTLVPLGYEAEGYRLTDGRLWVLDAHSGVYRVLGLANGVLGVYDSAGQASNAEIANGELRMYDTGTETWRALSFVGGVLTVLE